MAETRAEQKKQIAARNAAVVASGKVRAAEAKAEREERQAATAAAVKA